MAAYSMTITNSVGVFGVAPSNKWNAFAWNSFKWGEGTADLGVRVIKGLSETITLSDSMAVGMRFTRTFENPVTLGSDGSSQYVIAGIYYRVFPGQVTDGDDRASVSWSQVSPGSVTWTSYTVSSTSWSEA